MANTSSDYWSVDGVSIQTYAKNIETLGGRDTPPPLRGEDIVIPGVIGERWVPKVPGSRILSLGMWVRGTDDDGNVPAKGRKQTFDDNWRKLRNSFFTPGRQIKLTKRFVDPNGVSRTVSALAEYSDGLEPTMIGRHGAKFTVDLKLADPYFYDDAWTPISVPMGFSVVNMPGDALTNMLRITFNGDLVIPMIRDYNRDIEIMYRDTLNVGERAVVDVRNYKSRTTPLSNISFDSSSLISPRAGAQDWMNFMPGVNNISLTGSGSGAVTIEYKGAWL